MARIASKVGAATRQVASIAKAKTTASLSSSSSSKTASLTTAHLRLLLSQIGSATSGLKPVLHDRFDRALEEPLLLLKANRQDKTRVLSIDMGIRNLAYCIADIRLASPKSRSDSNDQKWVLDIVDWKRIDVVPSNKPPKKKQSRSRSSKNDISAGGLEAERGTDAGVAEVEKEAFSPQKLAPAAVSLARDVFLPTNPDLIAIERQRFRSGGQSAVLEWTLRVNMLESMLWTAFKSMPGTHQVVAVSPARVAKFWVPKAAGEKSAIEKAEKVGVIRRWLSGDCPPGLAVESADTAQETKETVLRGPVRGANKVDDLADCLLQAGALVMWERNRRTLLEMHMDHDKLKKYCSSIADGVEDDNT